MLGGIQLDQRIDWNEQLSIWIFSPTGLENKKARSENWSGWIKMPCIQRWQSR